MTPSSTSSSRRLPLAGLLALAIVFAVDRIAFGAFAPWGALAPHVVPGETPHHRVLHSRAVLDGVGRRAAGTRAALVVGSSRAGAGFSAATFARELPGVQVADFSFAGLRPFELRSLAPEFVAAAPDAVVIAFSEFDTHRTIRLSLVPGSSAADTGAVLELARLAGARFAWEQRTLLSRFVLSDLLETYRFRGMLRAAGLDTLRTFPRGQAHAPPRLRRRDRHLGPPRRRIAPVQAELLTRKFPSRRRNALRFQIDILRELQPGVHVPVQQALLERSIETLTTAGIRVVLVETPLHPDAVRIVPDELPGEFRAQAERLRDRHGVVWVPVAAPYRADDFSDLLHLTARGRERFSHTIATALAGLGS